MAYTRINWENGEAGDTPLNANNLNKMDAAIEMLDSKASDSDYSINTINAKLTQQDAAISGKMDKSNPSASGTLSVPQISVGKLSNYGGYDVTLPATVQIEDEQGNPSSILGAFNYIRDVALPKITENEQAIGEINNKLSGLGNEYLAKVNPMAQGTLVIDSTSPSSSGQILINSGQGSAGTVISSGLVSTLLGNFAFDIDLGTSSDYTDEPVLKVGKTINEMKKDINSLKKNVGTVVLADKSPLPACSASNIIGIDAKGKSEQVTNHFEQGGIGHTTNANYSANKVDGTTRVRIAELIPTVSGQTYNLTCNSGYTVIVQSFNASGLLVDTSGSNAWNNPLTVTASAYMGIAIRKSDNSNISVSEAISANVLVNGAPIFAPTPTNPIPIVDASGEVVARTINLCNLDNIVLGKSWNDTANASRGYVEITDVVVGETYTLSAENINGLSSISAMPMNGTELVGSAKTVDANTSSVSFAIANTVDKIRILFVAPSGTLTKAMAEGTETMFCKGTSTAYVPYQSNTITLPFSLPFSPKSVGSVANELIVNEDGSAKAIKNVETVDLGSLNWKASSGGSGRFFADLTDGKSSSELLCDVYPCEVSATYISGKITSRDNSGYLRICVLDDSFASADAFKTAMNGHILYYVLKTPIETPLTAEEVASIKQLQTYKGTTVIESELQIDSVTYAGDIKAYVDSKTDYSYTDTIIGKWADGKDLHRIVVNTNTPSSSGGIVIPFLNGNNCDIKNMYGFINWTSDTKVPINYYSTSTNFATTYPSTNGIVMSMGNSLINKPCEIIVEYTLKNSAPAAASVLSLDETEE